MTIPSPTLTSFAGGVKAEDADSTIVGQYMSYLLYSDPGAQFDDYYEWVNNSNNSPTTLQV